jgi:hypothetical protein
LAVLLLLGWLEVLILDAYALAAVERRQFFGGEGGVV